MSFMSQRVGSLRSCPSCAAPPEPLPLSALEAPEKIVRIVMAPDGTAVPLMLLACQTWPSFRRGSAKEKEDETART